MKILHVFNVAGVSNVLNKLINLKTSHSSEVVTRLYADTFGFSRFYGDRVYNRRDEIFFIQLLLKIKECDILHLNYWDKRLPLIRKIFRKKKIVLSYHGTDIREKVTEREKFYKHADFISVSTKDLTQYKFNFIPNIVDYHHFKQHGDIIKKEAVFFYLSLSEKEALERVKTLKNTFNDLNLTIVERWNTFIEYETMPIFLSRFEYLFDIKMLNKDKFYKKPIISPFDKSYTARQFLTMHEDKKVVNKDGKVSNGYKRKEKITYNDNILKKWIDVYENL